jgi:hypothetical protein
LAALAKKAGAMTKQLSLFEASRDAPGAGFVYRFSPASSVQWMIEAATLAHVKRWGRLPAMLRVNPAHVGAARAALDALGWETVAMLPNGGTLACEVEVWGSYEQAS